MTVGELVAYLNLDDRDFNRGVDGAERKFSGFGNRVGGIASTVGKVALGAAVGGIAAMGAGLIAGAVAGIKYNSAIEQTTIAMGTMLGSTAKAKTLIGEVTKMAAATPFEFPELADATKRLVAYGVSAKDAVPLMTRLGDVSSALSIPIGEMADLYGKMKVSGRISMEDINQMAGRGIPIYGALAKTLGVGQDKIRGLVEAGKIGFPDVEKAFNSLTDKGSMFGGMMDKQSRSFSGLWSTIKDGVIQAFGKALMPAFKWMTDVGMPALIKAMPQIQAAVGTAFSAAGKAVGILVDAFRFVVRNGDLIKTVVLAIAAGFVTYQAIMLTLKGVVIAYTAVQWLMNASLTANPIGLIVVGISALVAAFVVLWVKCDWFRNFWIATWEIVKTAFAAVWPAIKAVIGFLVGGFQWLWATVSAGITWFWGWAGPFITQSVALWWTVIKATVATIVTVVKACWDAVVVAVKWFWDWAGPFIKTAVAAWWENIKTTMHLIRVVFDTVWPVIVDIVRGAVKNVKAAIGAVETVVGVVRGVWNAVRSGAETVWNAIVGVVRAAIAGVKKSCEVVGDVKEMVLGAFRAIRDKAGDIWDGITGVVRSAFTHIKDYANDVLGVINWVVTKVNALAHTNVGTLPLFSGGTHSDNGGTGGTASASGSASSALSSIPANGIMDNGGTGAGGILGGIGSALSGVTDWVKDLWNKYGLGGKLPSPTGGLFGNATGAIYDIAKDAILGLLKKYGGGPGQQIIDWAKTQLGKPYLWGATGPDAYDCSGLIYRAYLTNGKSIPRSGMWAAGRQVSNANVRPADVGFFSPNVVQDGHLVKYGHVKMYAGNGQSIESTGGGVQMGAWGGASEIRTYLGKGGITRGLYVGGEGGKEEAVLPLTDTRAMNKLRAGLGGGVTNITMNVDKVYATTPAQAQAAGAAMMNGAIVKLAHAHRATNGGNG